MAAVVGSERAAMERFGSGGMALLPRTKQMLTVLWEQFRLLLQVIYYSCVSVFQMFRFEVHVRITDETGQPIQHMTTATNTTESFLFSSLFDGDSGVIVGGSNPLSNFCADVDDPFAAKSTAEALLSSLHADDLCCGLVDDFVSRTSSKEENLFLGHQSSWKMGFPGDWNIFVSSSDSSSEGCHQNNEKVFIQDTKKKKVIKQDTSKEERSFQWSGEEDQNTVEFDNEESKALWESLSTSSDPYNPLFFSACITTNTNLGKSIIEARHGRDSNMKSISTPVEEMSVPQALNFLVSRSDSESSWASSDSSSPDIDEESERLWDFFSSPEDPYNPMCFTACTVSSTGPTVAKQQASLPAPISKSNTDTEERESSFPTSSEDDEEDQLWKSLFQKDDPFHPLNFQACLHSSPTTPATASLQPAFEASGKRRPITPHLPEKKLKRNSHPERTLVPWRRPGQSVQSPTGEKKQNKANTAQKKVQFSPVVQVHVMWTWQFARKECRKGPWEQMVRDRDRFRRRIQETEKAIGYCLNPSHRENTSARLQEYALK